MKSLHLVSVAAVVVVLGGCSWFGAKKPDYKGAAARAGQPLEVPPELTTPTQDDRFAIPDAKAQTYSSYSRERAAGGTPGVAASPVLAPIEGARIERSGDQRWLVVKGAPEAVWPKVRDFWIEAGYTLTRESPEVGILETDWYEDRAKIPEDIIRRTVGRVFDKVYSTGTRDKYRIRLEKGTEPGTTEVFVTHRGMVEDFTNQHEDSTMWHPRPPDRGLESEMLSRIMVKLGAPETPKVAAAGAAGASTASAGSRNAALEGASLVVNDSFDRAWRRVGLALDRVGFTVEDRDRSKGLFFVRYIDPEADGGADPKKKKGILDRLAFWRSEKKAGAGQPQFRIHVGDAGTGMSQVEVQNAQGQPESGSTGKKILSLLFDQLK